MDTSDNQTNKSTSKNSNEPLGPSSEMSPNTEFSSEQKTQFKIDQGTNFDGFVEKSLIGDEEKDPNDNENRNAKGDEEKNFESDEDRYPKYEEGKNHKGDKEKVIESEDERSLEGDEEKDLEGDEEKIINGGEEKNLKADKEKNIKGNEEKNLTVDENNFIQEAEASHLKAVLVETPDGNFREASTKVSKIRVEQAMEILEKVENLQKNGEYASAVSYCKSAQLLLENSQDHIDLRMKLCSNIMQLYYLMGEIGEVLACYHESCVDVLESVNDPKVIQTIVDLRALCIERVKK